MFTLPVNCAVLVLLGDHEEGVGLRVGGGVGAEVVNVDAVNHLRLWLLVVVVVLDAVGHVLGHVAVLQLDVAARKTFSLS